MDMSTGRYTVMLYISWLGFHQWRSTILSWRGMPVTCRCSQMWTAPASATVYTRL